MNEYNANSLVETRPIVERDGGIELTLYDQADNLQTMIVANNDFNRRLVVWCRKFDRRSKEPK